MRAPARGVLILGLAVTAAAVILGIHAARFDLICDDAFISFRYARHFVETGALVYNLGERVEGYTNFLWTLMMAGVLALGGDPVPWSKLLGVACSVLTLILLAAFSESIVRSSKSPRSPLWSAIAPGLLASSPAFACWSTGGLETALFTLLVTAGLFRFVLEQRDRRRAPASAALLAAAAWTRPEGVLVFAIAAAYRGATWLRGPRPLRHDLTWLGLFLGLWGSYWIWRVSYYGHAFPNTFYVKAGESNWAGGLIYLKDWVRGEPWWLGAAAVLPLWRGSRHAKEALVVFGLVIGVMVLHVTRAGGDFMFLHRYFIPLYPLLAYVVQEGVAGGWRWASSVRSGSRAAVRGAAVLLLVLLLSAATWRGVRVDSAALRTEYRDGLDSIGLLKEYASSWASLARYMKRTFPADTRIALRPAGVIPYYTDFPTLDVLGLNDVWVARHGTSLGSGRPGHDKVAPLSYIASWNADLIIMHPSLEETPVAPAQDQIDAMAGQGYVFRTVHVPEVGAMWSFYEKERDPGQVRSR